jgi:uncharacterized protein involved in exopolysaccharide biosynthesis
MKSDYELSLRDYIAIIKDRALVLGVSAAVILVATVAVALMVPPIYQSTGTILVIAADFARAGVDQHQLCR